MGREESKAAVFQSFLWLRKARFTVYSGTSERDFISPPTPIQLPCYYPLCALDREVAFPAQRGDDCYFRPGTGKRNSLLSD